MTLSVVAAGGEQLRGLAVPGRPRVDPRDVVVPDGYEVTVVLVGLSFPTGMGFAPDGTLYVLEGGSTWPTRPYMPARVLRLSTDGRLDAVGEETLGGPRGVAPSFSTRTCDAPLNTSAIQPPPANRFRSCAWPRRRR